ncbi:coiled-coil domain-containing protein 82 isoform X2 [Mauremys reevesii]|uniref:coiled-coil domain-containing protein 82 isoform X2 n=1 Tax=Mauremys reevesii TaxID=260615 RepID=UPI00193EC773|nr:coiled-coil domain-containing protein 82 isoform X2 [Mauremys reevesii]
MCRPAGGRAQLLSRLSMETKLVIRRYETRRNTRIEEPASKSRVDWRRTKRETILLDSDEEPTSASEDEQLPSTSEDEVAEKQETVVKRYNLTDHEEKGHDDTVVEDVEDECITPGKRKRSSTSVMYDSDRSDDSDIPVRKVFAKRYCIMDEDECSQEQEQYKTPTTEDDLTNGKQKQLMKLKELARQRSTRASSNSKYCGDSDDDVEIIEESSYHLPLTPTESSDIDDDDDSMKDFIVEDEEECAEHSEDENQPQGKELATSKFQLLDYYIPRFSRCDHYVHFQRVVKAFLINTIDDTFLSSLYDGTRRKRYAQEMVTSLHYLDDRFIQPRLENLISRSRWKERYKERVDCYPEVRIVMKTPINRSCQACELHRYCKFAVLLSGKLYNYRTLETDDFMLDDKQVLKVGSVCANRTRVYHNLKHFKFKLYQRCRSVTEVEGIQDEPVKDTVDRLFSQLEESGWIQERYDYLEEYMNDADYFQEEKMD